MRQGISAPNAADGLVAILCLDDRQCCRSSIRKFIEHLRRPHDGAGFETQNTDSQKRTMTAGNRLGSALKTLEVLAQ